MTWFGIFLVGLGVAQAALAWHDGRRTPPRSWSERTFLYGNLSGAGIITVVGLVAMFTH